MSLEMRDGWARRRCDVCRKLIRVGKNPFFVHDTHVKRVIDCCSNKCRDNYFEDNYQLSLWPKDVNPYSNTGVLFNNQDET